MVLDRQSIYREIYEHHAGQIYGYIFRRICDSVSAEDLKQEVFVALLFNLSEFVPNYPENNRKILKWLFGVADNKIKMYWRDIQKHRDTELPLDEAENVIDVRDLFSRAELEFPNWLEPKDRELLALRVSGYSLKEAAGRLGMSYAGCRQRYSRMMHDLEAYYKK